MNVMILIHVNNIVAAIGVIMSLYRVVFAWLLDNYTTTIELVTYSNSVYIGDEVIFYCDIQPPNKRLPTGGLPLLINIRWFQNGVELMKYTDDNIGFNGRTIMFHNVRKSDAGNYTCQYDYAWNLISPPMPLKVNGDRPPGLPRPEKAKFYMHLVNTSQSPENLTEGDFVKLVCDIRPNSAKIFNLDIIHDRIIHSPRCGLFILDNIKRTDPSRFEDDRTLVFKNIKESDSGTYKCNAYTQIGWLHTRIKLNVKRRPTEEPQISEDMKNVSESFTTPYYAVYRHTTRNN